MDKNEFGLKDFEEKLSARFFTERAFNALFFYRLKGLDGGIKSPRLREGFAKQLIEEILPISAFLACFERPGVNLFCEWVSGNQNFDAKLYCEGELVDMGSLKREYFLEVSIACHPKAYLKSECVEKGIPAFEGDNIKRLSDGTVKSSPEARTSDNLINDHVNFIQGRITAKSGKYPDNTYLIIPLFPDTIIRPDEWKRILQNVLSLEGQNGFCGIFIYDTLCYRKAFF